jgi:hypothetical protein
MKIASLVFLWSLSAAAQVAGNVIVCDPADAEQCKATVIESRPMRVLVHDGTSVAVGNPVATAEGDYRVFVRVSQVGAGKTDVRPKHFSGISSDAAHTRFAFYDKAAEVRQRIREASGAQPTDEDDAPDIARRGSTQSMSASKAAKLGLRRTDPNEAVSREDEEASARGRAKVAGTTVTPEELYLSQSTLRQGDYAEGFVYFKKPRRSTVHVGLNDPLREIDIPMKGVVFRFN